MAELLPAALDPVRCGEVELHLPERLSVYGLTAADPIDLEVLEAVAAGRDVHLYLLHPSPVLWRDTAALLEGSPAGSPPARVSDPTLDVPRHPFLRSWAQESRELQMVLAARNHTGGASQPGPGVPSPTVLERLQQDIRTNTPPAASGALSEERIGDRSVQIHVCYGARRQVEVLRDAILHVLAADTTLEPRDIVVMTPDLATFAPLLEATFLRTVDIARSIPDSGPPADHADHADHPDHADQTGADDALPDLRLRIADRAPAATNPLVRFAATVLDLAGSRLEAGTVRELVAMPVVRQLFGVRRGDRRRDLGRDRGHQRAVGDRRGAPRPLECGHRR